MPVRSTGRPSTVRAGWSPRPRPTARRGSWDAATGGAVTPPLEHDGPVNRVEFRGDGRRLVTASDDGWVRIWDVDGGRADGRPSLRMAHGSPVQIALFSPDGRRVISGGSDGTIRIWDATDGSADRRRAPARFAAARPGAEPRRIADRQRADPQTGAPGSAGSKAAGLSAVIVLHARQAGAPGRLQPGRHPAGHGVHGRDGAGLGCPHGRAGHGADRPWPVARPCRVQPGRHAAGDGQRGRDGAGLGRPHRPAHRHGRRGR